MKYVAGRMSSGLPAHVEEADLISYGLIGLINAIERFDPEREIKFETYAITRIKGAIIDELRALDWVPRSVRARAREIERANAKLEHQLQRAPTDEEMAAELELTVEEFQEALVQISNSTVVALDELWTVVGLQRRPGLAAGHAARPGRARPGAGAWTRPSSRTAWPTRSRALPEREKLVIALYYYENLTLREIGEVLGVTESRISQLHTKAVLRLRRACQSDDLARLAIARDAVASLVPARGEEESGMHARRRQDPQRGPRRPPREREDVAARGAAASRPARRTGSARWPTARRCRTPTSDEKARADVDLARRWPRSSGTTRKVNLIDTPGEPSFVADALGALRVCESAVFVVNARAWASRSSTHAPVAARRRSSTSRAWSS